MSHTHTYRATLIWEGSTSEGYHRYDRTHIVEVPPAATPLTLSGDPAFKGDSARPNPEQLLLAAASSCQLLSFLAYAARSRIEVLTYTDDAEAVMPEDDLPMRITRITLRPRITVGPGANVDRVYRLVDKAHDECYIANTLNAEVRIEAEVREGAVNS
jgi:organic hydroperoxide reductase OsmC/OhrA